MNLQGFPERNYFYRRGKAEGEAEGEARGKAEGKAEGKVGALLSILDVRGIELSQEERDRVLACSDVDVLDAWIKRAVNAKDAAEVFAA